VEFSVLVERLTTIDLLRLPQNLFLKLNHLLASLFPLPGDPVVGYAFTLYAFNEQ
jgi:hypothetical protein